MAKGNSRIREEWFRRVDGPGRLYRRKHFPAAVVLDILKIARRLSRRSYEMHKYLMVALLVVATTFPVFGATHAAERGTAGHAAVHKKVTTHRLTAAQLRARERRIAAHRAYERRLAHARWLRRHRAYEARLARERRLREHRAYEARLAREHSVRRHVRRATAASAHRDGVEVARLTPAATPGAVTGTVHPATLDYVSHEHVHLYWRSPLRGTHASLVRQNERDRAEGLTRIKDEAQLEAMVHDHDLVALPVSGNVQVDPRLAQDRRYTRPWTAQFMRQLGRSFAHQFGEPLVITSAVRPASYQERLMWRNGNAAPANGAIASPHEFGATVDIGKKGMTAREMAWMRGYLLPLQEAGQIDVEEEFYQACFHVTVYKSYVPAPVAGPRPGMVETAMEEGAR